MAEDYENGEDGDDIPPEMREFFDKQINHAIEGFQQMLGTHHEMHQRQARVQAHEWMTELREFFNVLSEKQLKTFAQMMWNIANENIPRAGALYLHGVAQATLWHKFDNIDAMLDRIRDEDEEDDSG